MKYPVCIAFGLLVLLFPLAAQNAGQPDTQNSADLEASIFANSSDGSPPSSSVSGEAPAVTSAQTGGDQNGFPSFTPGETAKTDYLVGGSVVASGSTTTQTQSAGYLALSDLQGKLFAKVTVPDYGSLFVSYAAAQPLFRGASGSGVPSLVSLGNMGSGYPNAYAVQYNLSEIHYSFDIAKVLFVRVGNQLISWGPSQIWTPVDFINLQKSDAFAALDTRIGKPGLRLHMPLSWGNLFAFADFSNLVTNGQYTYSDPVDKTNLGGRVDFTAGDFEFGLTGYGGAQAQTRGGVDFSGRLLGTTVYGELAAAPDYSSYTSYVQTALGFSKTLDELKRWTLSAEAFYNSKGDPQSYLYRGRYYAYLALKADEFISPYLSSTVSALSNLDDQSYQIKLAESFSFPRAVPFTAELSYSGGGTNTELTQYTGAGAIALRLYTVISF